MSHYRTFIINEQLVTVRHTDYDYRLGGETIGRFNLTMKVELGGELYPVCFSNVTLGNEALVYRDQLQPCGDEYERFLQALETEPQYKEAGRYRDVVAQQARDSLGSVAEALFLDVRAHSPDQDEE